MVHVLVIVLRDIALHMHAVQFGSLVAEIANTLRVQGYPKRKAHHRKYSPVREIELRVVWYCTINRLLRLVTWTGR